ncbi:MAG: TRAP transporter large permease [Planctomycetaceae bacterium]|nr:TRAP transporter large permease [Planctomycetaceae bacterium]
MSISLVGLAIAVLLVSLFLKVPVFISLLAGSITYFMLSPNANQMVMVQRFAAGLESVPLLAIPFFVCAGIFMNSSGVTARIMGFCNVVTARMWGGLAQVNILLSTLMGGLSGSNLADAAMQSKMVVPEMEKQGMSKPFSTVVTAFSSTITPLIPPGIGMILYGSIANVSIGKLFIAGISVGAVLCLSMMILTSILSRRFGYGPSRAAMPGLSELFTAFRPAFLPFCLPVIIIGGIRIGVFTPTEAGAVAVLYAGFLGLLYRELSLSKIITSVKETVTITSTIMLIVGGASALAWVLTREQIPQNLTLWMVNTIDNKYLFLILVNLFLLIVGMFIEGNAATVILVPLLAPIARAYGIDDIQFAFVFIFNMAIGAITPPMGTLMFVTCSITKCKIRDFLVSAVPYFCLMLFCLLLITFVPGVTTGILKLFY